MSMKQKWPWHIAKILEGIQIENVADWNLIGQGASDGCIEKEDNAEYNLKDMDGEFNN